jgi:hypothetical protein
MMGTNSWGVPVSRSRECKLHCNPSLCDLGLPRAVKLNWNEIYICAGMAITFTYTLTQVYTPILIYVHICVCIHT